jgi:hypothetical protein
MTTAKIEFSEADRDAMKRALEAMRASDPPRREQIEDKLQREGYVEACWFAAYSQQIDNLHLPPWKSPPCDSFDGDEFDPEIAEIVKRLKRYGLSLFEPDPIAAIEAARRRGGT